MTNRLPSLTVVALLLGTAAASTERAMSLRVQGQGGVVLGIPSNDFGGQEPGGAEQIARFCELRYARKHGAPKWNFHKYLVGKDG